MMVQDSFIINAFTINHNFSVVTGCDSYGVFFMNNDRMLGLNAK